MCSLGSGGRPRTGSAPKALGSLPSGGHCIPRRGSPCLGLSLSRQASKLRVPGSLPGPANTPSQKPADWPDQAKDVPLGDPGPSCFQDEYVWRLSQLLGSVPPSQEELSPCGSESICTEDFEAYFQEAMVEATPPSGARTGSPESLGGHISRVSQGPPPQPLSSRKHQQPPEEKGAPSQESSQALPEDPSPRLGPAALGTARGRSLLQLGGSFPEKWRPKRDPGVGPARRQHGDPGEPSPHTESRNAQQPLTPSPHDRRVHWDCELPPDLLPNDPARRQLSRPLAVPFSSGPQDPRLCLAQARGNLSASLWEPGSLLPSCLLGYRAPGSQKEEPRLSHRKGLKKEQETPGDPKPWKWSKKLESMKDGGPSQLGVMGATNTKLKEVQADSGKSGRPQQLIPQTPASVDTPRPGSPGLGLPLLGALIEVARRRLWDVDREAEALLEAVRELQRNRVGAGTWGALGEKGKPCSGSCNHNEAVLQRQSCPGTWLCGLPHPPEGPEMPS
ncbi:histone-lysine N-methyltransferase 2D-like isoform X1 [Dromiciops gliroides]|uniref:histone-lysine N-methyltransferase 2D-like isoform X1 n=1 Tax=Dromiciops gliroides TaxID=33562 RepID=UPI001CC750E6|nr:histone-lysine N-methyltransferase 2D-like isoform X1 [Dromiciops gliroides]